MTDSAYRPHPSDRLQQVFASVTKHGPRLSRIAVEHGLTVGQVAGIKRRHRDEWDAALAAGNHVQGDTPPATSTQEVSQQQSGDEQTFSAKGTRIKTVDELLAHINADLEKNEVVESQATKNEQVSKHPETGALTVTEYFRVFVKLRPKKAGNVLEAAEQMLLTALRERQAPALKVAPKSQSNIWQVVNVADPHFGKYSWQGTTGYPDYDLSIAKQHVMGAGLELLQWGDQTFKPGRRTLAFLGDIFHYDTPQGTTTGGTPLERDGRMPKMVDAGTDTILRLIEASARTAPTDVVFVRGNHDEALTTFLQKTVVEVFRREPRITVDETHTHRKYLFHEGTLLGFTHGDKAKKRLPSLMPHEAKEFWHQSRYYEWHTGHTHAMKAEWQKPIETIDGVLVRVSPALCPPDDWHADLGFVGSLKAMETFFYRPGGGFVNMHVSSPDYGAAG